MPFENLSLQLEADSCQRTLHALLDQYDRLMNIPEPLRHTITEQLDAKIKALEDKLKEYEKKGIRPNPPGTIY